MISSRSFPLHIAFLIASLVALSGFFMPLTTHALVPSEFVIDDGGDGGGGTEPGGDSTTMVSITASPSSIESGYSSQLSFSSSNAIRCVIDNGIGAVSSNMGGTRIVSPTQSTTYRIACDGPVVDVTDEVIVSVVPAPTPLTAYCEAGPDTAQINETVQWNSTYSAGSTSDLAWKRGASFTTKVCSGGQNYTSLNRTCPEGITDGDACSIEGQRCRESSGCDGVTYTDGEGQPNAHTQYGSVTPYTCVASDVAATYSYAWTGTDGLSGLSQNISKAYATVGAKIGRVTITRSTGGSGATSGYGWRAIGSQSGPTCTDDVNSVTGGADHRSQPICSASTVGTRYTQYDIEAATQSTCPSAYGNNGYSVTGQEYVCEANSGSTTGTASASCTANISAKTPTATLSANPSSIETGSSSTLTWGSTNAGACTLNESIGSVSTSGTRSVSPDATTTYTLMCTASGSTSSAGTWQYYDSDISDFACPVTDTNKAYSSVPNCPGNPQGKACTNAPGMTVCKVNTVEACNINTDIYQCQGSATSPAQVATASATVTVTKKALPDVTAGAITPTTARVGQTATLSGTVTNIGGAVASASNTYFLLKNSSGKAIYSTTVNVPAIQPGAGDTRSFSYKFTAEGTYQAQVCGDWFGSVAEANEGNNCGPLTPISVTSIVNANTVSCSVSNTSVNPGGSVVYTAIPSGGASGPYTWVAPDGATGFGSGSTANRTFTTAGNYGMQVSATGASVAATCPVVSVAACTGTRTVEITAVPARVRPGNSTTLSWSAGGINTSCVITGPGVSQTVSAAACTVPAGSSPTGTITSQSTYTISCDSGAITDSVIVNVIPEFEEF